MQNEQQFILQTKTVCDEEHSSPACTMVDAFSTKDKIFLLSYREAAQYFHSDEERIAYGTPYTGILAQNDPHYSIGKTSIVLPDRCRWILRTSGPTAYSVSCVHDNGSIDTNSGVKSRKMIRPAMWIRMEKSNLEPIDESYTKAPDGYLEYYVFPKKTSYCPFDNTFLSQEPVEVEHMTGVIKKINFSVCHVCNRLYSRNASNTINLEDYKLYRRDLPYHTLSVELTSNQQNSIGVPTVNTYQEAEFAESP